MSARQAAEIGGKKHRAPLTQIIQDSVAVDAGRHQNQDKRIKETLNQ